MSKMIQEGKRQQNLTPMLEILNPLVKFNPIMDIKVSNLKISLVTFFNPKNTLLFIDFNILLKRKKQFNKQKNMMIILMS